MLNDLGRVDDSALSADAAQNSEHLALKKERDEKRAALYK